MIVVDEVCVVYVFVFVVGYCNIDVFVLGGVVGVENGILVFMVGGVDEDYMVVLLLFEVMGKCIVYCGGLGLG